MTVPRVLNKSYYSLAGELVGGTGDFVGDIVGDIVGFDVNGDFVGDVVGAQLVQCFMKKTTVSNIYRPCLYLDGNNVGT